MLKPLILLEFTFIVIFSTLSQASDSPYDAARKGDLDTLRQYRFEDNDLFVPDERGFTPYELAALHADPGTAGELAKHVEVMLWLKEYKPEKHRFGKATYVLIQSGLKALGYNAGIVDGLPGKKTTDAIKAYQKNNGLATTGRPGPQWLGTFYKDIVKDTQYKLTQLGFNTQGTDGAIGPNTKKALMTFRSTYNLPTPDYSDLDGILIQTVNQRYRAKEQKRLAALAKKTREAEQKRTRFIQAGLKTLGYRIGKIDGLTGSKTINNVKKFQKKQNIEATGRVDKKTYLAMYGAFLKATQKKLNALGYHTGKADGILGNKTRQAMALFKQKYKLNTSGFSASLIANVNERYNRSPQKTQPPGGSKSDKRSSTNSSNSRQSVGKTTINTQVNTDKIRGHMTFNRRSGRVIGCQIAGRNIPIEWCEPFYPLPKNNLCEATFNPRSHSVINLWCK